MRKHRFAWLVAGVMVTIALAAVATAKTTIVKGVVQDGSKQAVPAAVGVPHPGRGRRQARQDAVDRDPEGRSERRADGRQSRGQPGHVPEGNDRQERRLHHLRRGRREVLRLRGAVRPRSSPRRRPLQQGDGGRGTRQDAPGDPGVRQDAGQRHVRRELQVPPLPQGFRRREEDPPQARHSPRSASRASCRTSPAFPASTTGSTS